MKTAFLQFGESSLPMFRVQVDVKEKPLPHHKLGLQYTATGYGSKLPTRYMIMYRNRWRRVYSICYSNVSTEYVLIDGERFIIHFCE